MRRVVAGAGTPVARGAKTVRGVSAGRAARAPPKQIWASLGRTRTSGVNLGSQITFGGVV